ncbi:hypothetical protein IJ21_17280 [Paenibacillus sp. 32O-W]|uniref:Uncharacterized protein n=1 Tax=Paenibacillus cisolokensis TaxID=1658519 RepID=A0ABQ4N0B0_9BACL|nr:MULTISPECIES: hypothetical protein [Paenibacillus]ALS27129.1 hypothetical protein IJ21_17280 [Paenibacillus sp. 32O-W]GIQ61602.1 hypothetical protein PACILC2_01700 [Paenibacillus cisolokensis]
MHDHMEKAWLDLDYAPKLPRDKTRGIGIVGAGAIVQACHLPAYRMAGLNVVPLTPSELEDAFRSLKEKPVRESQEKQDLILLKQKLQESIPILKERKHNN